MCCSLDSPEFWLLFVKEEEEEEEEQEEEEDCDSLFW